ncbi:MAG: glucosamine-6-phosphate deaminase NagB [Rhodobacteraceae bacterium HLUCCA08]|nr:MAG: glucosamine-6-phosphate deaminase NagB [Rhodobacteraceae bacterium HLUCCA08]
MRVLLFDTADAATAEVVARIAGAVRRHPACVLGLATGGTMEPVYAGLIEAHRAGLSFAAATCFNLDEYVGLSPDHPQSYHSYMERHFFAHVDLPAGRRFLPRGDVDPRRASAEYEALLARHGPVDLQLLGLGHNGHIGFNEPGSSPLSLTREVTLTRRTLEANGRYFAGGELPPKTAITMGIGSILRARAVVVLAVGDGKAEAVAEMIDGPVDPACPGSVLRGHDDVTVVVDAAAGARLRRADRYRATDPVGGAAE